MSTDSFEAIKNSNNDHWVSSNPKDTITSIEWSPDDRNFIVASVTLFFF